SLNPNDLDLRRELPGGSADSANQGSVTDGNVNRVHLGQLVQHFARNRAGSDWKKRVGCITEQKSAGSSCIACSAGCGFGEIKPIFDHTCSQAGYDLALLLVRAARQENCRG